jgi:nitrate/TMAO reductase-like tetraheme cytochrome c subunit
MKMSKLTILMIAVIAIGIFALPAAFSVNTGQHTFRQINPDAPADFCNQCHVAGDSVTTELAASQNGIYNGPMKIHSSLNCGNCHELTQGYGTSFPGSGITKTEHAAIIPSCLKCHDAGDAAGLGFDVPAELMGAKEAHRPFWEASVAANTPSAANTDDLACLGCHTAVPKSGTVVYDYTITHTYNLAGLTIGSSTPLP